MIISEKYLQAAKLTYEEIEDAFFEHEKRFGFRQILIGLNGNCHGIDALIALDAVKSGHPYDQTKLINEAERSAFFESM